MSLRKTNIHRGITTMTIATITAMAIATATTTAPIILRVYNFLVLFFRWVVATMSSVSIMSMPITPVSIVSVSENTCLDSSTDSAKGK